MALAIAGVIVLGQPLLLIVGGYSPVVAIGTDLAYGAIIY